MFELIRAYLPEYKHYRGKLLLALLGMVLVAGASASIAWMMKPLLDEVFIARNLTMLFWMPVFIIVAYLAKGVGGFLQSYMMNYVGQDIVRKVRDRLLAHMLQLDLAFFHRYHSGELLSRITNDIGRIQSSVSTNLAGLVRESMMAVALLGVVIYQSPKLSFLTLVVLPGVYYPVQKISRKLKKIAHSAQGRNAALTSNLAEVFNNVEAIKAYHTETFESARFADTNHASFKINMKSVRTSGMMVPVMELFTAFSGAIVIAVGGQQVIDGAMTVGAFFSFLTALFMAVDPFRRITQMYASFQEAVAAHERIQDMMALQPEVKSGRAELGPVESIEFRKVFLSYDGKQALQGVDLIARKGEVIALVGGSGGGKSSIASLLLRFIDAEAGMVLMNGGDIRGYSLQSVRSRIAIVTQRVHIFNDTIAANVAYGQPVDQARVIRALEKANVWKHVESMPDGVFAQLNEAGTNLSGGQRQRIAIARALYRDPSVLILDEATSALDNQSESAILDTLQQLAPDVITVIIAHRLKSVELADRIYLVQGGEVICTGNKFELMHDCAAFRALYQ